MRKVVRVGGNPTGIAYGAGSLWVTNQSDSTVTRLDPATLQQDAPIPVGAGPVGIAFGDGAVWVANNLDGSLSRIDVADHEVTSRTVDADGGAYGVAVEGRNLWMTNEYAGTLSQVNTRRFTLVSTVATGGAPLGLAVSGDRLWFASAEAGQALHRGGTLKIAAQGLDLFAGSRDPRVIDPATAYDMWMWRLLAMTNNGLVGFRRTGGVGGALLVPDLATTLAVPTDDGRTYTFRLRRGIRYSTGDLVQASDIRRGIERTMQHKRGAWRYFRVIVGAVGCHQKPETCDLSAGVVADDRAGTVTFHLTRPEPDFYRLLALPAAYATPAETPVDLTTGTQLPATGPYLVASYDPAPADKTGQAIGPGRLELVRNPRFRQWSGAAQPDGYVDRIVIDTGLSEEQTLQQVSEGRADLMWGNLPPDKAPDLQARFPAQVHEVDGVYTHFAYLNTTLPPFDNRDARRAVAYGLDRRALSSDPTTPAAYGFGEVTCQALPPYFPGYEPYCPYTLPSGEKGKWTAPDLLEAQRLVRASGTKGAQVEVSVLEHEEGTARKFVGLLDDLGYRASLHLIPGDEYNKIWTEGARIQAGLLGWGADFPGAANFLPDLVSCKTRYPDDGANFSHFCDRKIEAQIDQALKLSGTNAAGAAVLWAAIDKQVVDEAPIVPFSFETRYEFVSPRVGNYQYHPHFGPLPAQMWVN